MIRLSNPEDESRTLINSMAAYHKSNKSVDDEQYFHHAHMNYSDMRDSMSIESAEEDKYIEVLCNLLDESVQFNESRKVNNLIVVFLLCARNINKTWIT